MTRTITRSEEETIAAGRALGEQLRAGDVALLTGPLGAGKTAFARGIAEGLGCDLSGVSSPTFTIIQEYPGAVPLQHVDLYRLSPAEVDDLLLEELLDGCAMAVEWPDRWRRAPSEAWRVTITPIADNEREIEMARGSGH